MRLPTLPSRRRLAAAVPLALALAAPLTPLPAVASTPRGLTPHQERVVLDLVDDTCGDTWCEGDAAFDFRRLTCDAEARSCTLRVRVASRDTEPLRWRTRSGELHGFVRFGSMVTTSPSGSRSLTPRFSEAVGALLERLAHSS